MTAPDWSSLAPPSAASGLVRVFPQTPDQTTDVVNMNWLITNDAPWFVAGSADHYIRIRDSAITNVP